MRADIVVKIGEKELSTFITEEHLEDYIYIEYLKSMFIPTIVKLFKKELERQKETVQV